MVLLLLFRCCFREVKQSRKRLCNKCWVIISCVWCIHIIHYVLNVVAYVHCRRAGIIWVFSGHPWILHRKIPNVFHLVWIYLQDATVTLTYINMLKVVLVAILSLCYCGKCVFFYLSNLLCLVVVLDALPVSQINFNDEWNYRTDTHIDPMLNSSQNTFLMPFYKFAKVIRYIICGLFN